MVEEDKVVNKTLMDFALSFTGMVQSKGNFAWFMAKVFCKTILGLLKG